MPLYGFDPAKAEALLDEAGYPRKDDRARLSISFDSDTNSEAIQNPAEFLKQNLKQIGVDLKLRSQDTPTLYKRLYTDYDFQAPVGQFSALIDPAVGLYRLYATSSIAKDVPNTNGSRNSNRLLDKIIETTQSETDPEKRMQAFADWQRIAQADLPNIPLFELQRVTVSSRALHGLPDTPDQAFSSLKSVWLDGGA